MEVHMLALIAAVLLVLASFGVRFGDVSIFYLALAFWAAHFAFALPIYWPRRQA